MDWRRSGMAVALVVVLLPVCGAAQVAPAAKSAKAAAKLLTAYGSVTAVSANSVIVNETGCSTCNAGMGNPEEEYTYVVSPKTKFVRQGRAIAPDKATKELPVITDFVMVGQMLGVTYREVGGTRQAVSVTLDGFPAK